MPPPYFPDIDKASYHYSHTEADKYRDAYR